MGFKLNLTKDESDAAQGGQPKPLPAGTYGAVIYSNVQGKSKNSGNEMFTIDFKITDGPVQTKRKIRGWFTLEGKGLFKLVELNKAVGFAYPKKGFEGEFEFAEPEEYVGIDVNLKLGVEEYETVDDDGNDATGERNFIARVNPYDESKIDHDTEDAADAGSGLFLK